MTLLLDSNVLVAALDRDHIHHEWSFQLTASRTRPFLVSTHAVSEAFNVLTRTGANAAGFAPDRTLEIIIRLISDWRTRALEHAETLRAIREFAEFGGGGARLYDYLIGTVAVLEGADTIATWNVKHFAPLFPALRVATPHELLES